MALLEREDSLSLSQRVPRRGEEWECHLRGAPEGEDLTPPRSLFPGDDRVDAREELVSESESWAPGVRKVGLFQQGQRKATVYLDLEARVGKPSGAAHFSVALACDVDAKDRALFFAPSGEAIASWGLVRPARQHAVVALVCNLDKTASRADVETVAHEWGHVLHSALSTSTAQHLSGTRGATDVAELPSTLLEHLAWHDDAREAVFGGGAGRALSRALDGARRVRAATRGLDALHQHTLAVFDLALHGAFGKDAATFRGASTLARTRTKSPVDDRGLAAFAHVATAPATYYAYAYDRAIAKAVWADFDGAKLLRFLQVASEANDPAVPLSALLAPPQAASGGATPTRSPSRTDVASS